MEPQYLRNVATLKIDQEKCTGCGMCLEVCPHAVFEPEDGKVRIAERDSCMECGACAKNCPFFAISVRPGVGCAYAITWSRLRGKKEISCGPDSDG